MVALLIVTGFFGIWGYRNYQARQQLEHYLGNKYREAFYQMIDNIEDMQVLLGKSLVSVSPYHNIISLNNIWSKAMDAQEHLTRLPLDTADVYRTATYLSQTGDYAHSLARKNAEGQVLTEEDRNQLGELRAQASHLIGELQQLEEEVIADNIDWQEIIRGTRELVQQEGTTGFRDGFHNIQQELNKHPTLIYDGPFSDHVARMEPRELTGEEVTTALASEKAKELIDTAASEELNIIDSGRIQGRIEAFNFQIRENESRYSIDISKTGGYLLNLTGYREIDSKDITLEEAIDQAQEYVHSAGFDNMTATYGEIEDSTAFVTLVYQEDDIIYYPDMVKVQVALDNGQIISADALNYLINHHQRDITQPEITEGEIRSIFEERFTEVESINLALIPQDGLQEALTYEVRVQHGSEKYLVYIDAVTGVEKEILQLIESDQGIFTL